MILRKYLILIFWLALFFLMLSLGSCAKRKSTNESILRIEKLMPDHLDSTFVWLDSLSRIKSQRPVDVAGHQAADLLQREPSSCQPGALRRWTDERLVRIVHKPEHRSELVFEAWVLFFEKAFKARELCADSG